MPPLPRGHLVPTSSALLIGLERPSGPCRVCCLVTHRQAWLAGSGKAPVWSVLTRCKGGSARRPGWPWTGARPAPAPALDPASARGRPLAAARGTGWSRAVASPRAAFAQSPALSARASLWSAAVLRFSPVASASVLTAPSSTWPQPRVWSPALSSHLSVAFPPAEA